MNLSFEFLLSLTFEVMNKVMNNLKNLDITTLIELVNENVIPRFLNKFTKGQFLLPFFFVRML
jgi:hypothetical protein